MRARVPFVLSFVLALGGCEVGLGAGAAAGSHAADDARDDLLSKAELAEIAPGVLVHTSYHALADGIFPSNGLLLCHPGEGALVDTAWGDTPTAHLLAEAERRGCPVKNAVFTHAHDDRTGGLSTLFARGVRVHATAATRDLLARPGFAPEPLAPPATLRLAATELEVFFPGPAHAPDNVVVYLPATKVLFAGCMVKARVARSLGNVHDASIGSWPAALRRVEERYPEATIVVPGHGDRGGRELLHHTATLLGAAQHP